MAQIDNLEIVIASNAGDAAQKINNLASSLSGLKSSSSNAAGGLRAIKDELVHADASARDVADNAGNLGNKFAELGKRIQTTMGSTKGFGGTLKGLIGVLKGAAGGLLGFLGGMARIAKYRFIRAMIKDLVQSFKDLYGYSDKFGTGFSDAMDKITTSTTYFRNSLVAMVSPLIEILAPALDFVVDKVVEVLNWFNQLFAALSGATTYTAARKVSREWSDTFNNVNNNARRTQKELKRTILGFDEINKLNDANKGGSNGGNGNSPYTDGYQLMFEQRQIGSGFTGFSNAIETALSNTLSKITMIVSGASLALGAILLFSGVNPPLGLSLMVAGAAGLATTIAMNWDGLSADVKLVIGAIETALGGALLAIGAILAFSGANVPLGIALMVAGAGTVAAAVALNWDLLTGKVSVSAKGVATAVSLATVAVGALLAFTGVNVPLGIGLIAGGITGAVATLNWDAVSNLLKGPLGTATETVSGALLVMGMISIMTTHVALGIGLLAAGVAGLSAFAFVNNDALAQALNDPIGRATAFVAAATLVMGVIALVSGRSALGIALMATGVGALSAFAFVNNNAIKDALQGPIGTATALVSGASLVMGVIALITSHTVLGIALLATGVAGLSAFAFVNKDAIKDVMKGPIGTATAFIGAASLVMGVIALMASYTTLGFALLATGVASLSAFAFSNKDALANVLKDPVNKAIAFVGSALLAVGVIALMAGHSGLGFALLATGVAALSAFAFVNNNAVKDVLKGPVGIAIEYVSGASLVMGVIALMAGHPALGFALLATGVAGLSAFAFVNNNAIEDALKEPVNKAIAFVGGASLVVGVIALITGHSALGLALLAAGVSTLTAFAFVNNNAVTDALKGPIGNAVAFVAGASLVVGVIAMVAGLPTLGFALMAAGVAGLTAFAFVNNNALANALSEPVNKATAIVSGASLVVGVIAMLSGNATLGFALLATGVGGLTAFAFINNNAIAEALQGPVGLAVGVVSGAALLLGIVAMVTGNIPLGLALLLSGAAGLAEAISANWDNLKQLGVDAINKVKEGWDSVKEFFTINILPTTENKWLAGFLGINTPDEVARIREEDQGVQRYAQELARQNGTSSPMNFDLNVNATAGFGMTTGQDGVVLAPIPDADANVVPEVTNNTNDLLSKFKEWWDVSRSKWWNTLNLNPEIVNNANNLLKTYKDWWDAQRENWWNKLKISPEAENTASTMLSNVKAWWDEKKDNWWNKLYASVEVKNDSWSWWNNVTSWWNNYSKNNTLTAKVSVGGGGGVTRYNTTRKNGGVFSGGAWSDIPQYAGGTFNAHGSLFLAGEAGPEIVGHVGGRTEVLNKSQLAATMYSAVQAAMAPASANFAAAATQMYQGANDGEDMETLMEMVRQTNDATMRQNELLRQQNDYLRQLNERDLTVDITTSGISRAQARANRRAGTTVIPVGT